MEEPGQPTIGGLADPAYKYPRVIVRDPGIPEGWKCVEGAMGPNSKNPGSIYIRYSSLDGRHRSLSGIGAISKHCEDNGIADPEPMIEEFRRLQKDPPEGSRLWLSQHPPVGSRLWLRQESMEKQKEETRIRSKAREAEKAAEQKKIRDATIARFEEQLGKLTGPIVSAFPGWTTTWDYLPNSGQVQTRYIDPDNGDWFILKDLEAALQLRIDNGELGPGGVDIGDMVEAGRQNADEVAFSEGAATARATEGRFERTAGSGEAKVLTREESMAQREARKLENEAKRAAKTPEERQAKKMRHSCYGLVSPHPRGPVQQEWASLGSVEDVQVAFTTFRQCLEARGFAEAVELVAVHGASPERRYVRRIVGVYVQMDTRVEGRSCYQKLLHAPDLTPAMCCDSVYIIWNPSVSRWQIVTKPGADELCLAFCEDPQEHFTNVKRAWRVQEGWNDFHEDSNISVSTPETCSSA